MNLQVNDVSFSYTPDVLVLDKITFTLHDSERLALTGPCGAGKSTLLSMLNGWELPTAGEIFLGETLLTKKTRDKFRQNVGIVFSDTESQLFSPTLFDDIAFGLRQMSLSESEIEKRVFNIIKDFGLTGLEKRPPYCLSEGEKRLAVVAAVVVLDPRILILDEPTANLDSLSIDRLTTWLSKWKKSLLIAGHDQEFMKSLTTKEIRMENGKIC
jgi:cobalt/nickel transport system ATP-binding protein